MILLRCFYRDVRKGLSALPPCACLAAVFYFLFNVPTNAADKNSAKAKKKAPVVAEAASLKDKSVEELAEYAKESVVVISHYGRDGSIDGVGSGFVVSSNGLIATSLHVIGEARPISVQFS